MRRHYPDSVICRRVRARCLEKKEQEQIVSLDDEQRPFKEPLLERAQDLVLRVFYDLHFLLFSHFPPRPAPYTVSETLAVAGRVGWLQTSTDFLLHPSPPPLRVFDALRLVLIPLHRVRNYF